MQSVLTHINALRHSRGFGIHSPFAFRFVTEVLCQPLPYYAYGMLGSDPRLRLIHRLTAYWQPARICLLARDTEPLLAAAKSARTSIETVTADMQPDMLIADDMDTDTELYLGLLAGGHTHAVVLNSDKHTRSAVCGALPHGMTFCGSHGTLVVAACRHLPRQDFNVKF